MTLPLWGALEKAQDDDQTIVEAIAEAIAEHEADPEAHLGEGESLEMHKTEDVIDHPAFSVLDDKFAYDRRTFIPNLADHEIYDEGSNVELNGYGTLLLVAPASMATMWFGVIPSDLSGADWFEYQKNPRFIISFAVSSLASQVAYLLVADPNTLEGFGFKIVNDKLNFYYTDSNDDEQLTEIFTISSGILYKLEARVFYGEKIDVYVDNVLTETILSPDLPSSIATQPYHVWVKINATAAFGKELYISDIYWDADR